MNNSIATRKLTSNLWVWYPIILSRFKSFHHKNLVVTRSKPGKSTIVKDNFKWNHKTRFLIKEKRIKETKKGQNDVCTAIKGDLNNLFLRR